MVLSDYWPGSLHCTLILTFCALSLTVSGNLILPRLTALKIFIFVFFFRATPAALGSSQLGSNLSGQLRSYATATATWEPRCVGDLHYSSQQCRLLNPLSEARDWTCILMDTCQVHYYQAMTGTPKDASWHVFSSLLSSGSGLPWFLLFFLAYFSHSSFTLFSKPLSSLQRPYFWRSPV